MRFFKPHISLIYNTGEIFYHNISYIKVFLSCPHLSGIRFMFPDNAHLIKKHGRQWGRCGLIRRKINLKWKNHLPEIEQIFGKNQIMW